VAEAQCPHQYPAITAYRVGIRNKVYEDEPIAYGVRWNGYRRAPAGLVERSCA
jgi:hypothetical protein